MGSSPSKELTSDRKNCKTTKRHSKAGLPSKPKTEVIYRDQNLNQVPSTLTNTLIENVFLISTGTAVGEDLPDGCVYVGQTAKSSDDPLLTSSNLDQAVFERILSPNPSRVTVKSTGLSTPTEFGPCDEKYALKYMYQCFERWKTCADEDMYFSIFDDVVRCEDVILQNTQVCLRQPGLFPDQQMHKQFIEICLDNQDKLFEKGSHINSFLVELFAILDSERGCMQECLVPVLKHMKRKFQREFKLTKMDEIRRYMLVLKVFTLRSSLATVFIEYNKPADWSKPKAYEDTLLGSILSMNTCPKTGKDPYEFFNEPIDMSWQEMAETLKYIWQSVTDLCDDLYKILIGCIRLSEDLRHLVLNWFGRCLEANRGKPDFWSAHEVEVFDTPYCSDGFCLNMCQILLHMCQSFSETNSHVMLQIKPSYCRSYQQKEDERKTMCVHARGLDKEATFVPYTDNSQLPHCTFFHNVSDYFFLTHQALHIGYSVVFKLIKLNGSMNRMEKLYNDIKDIYPRHIVDPVRHQLNRETCWYLNIKAALGQQQLNMRCLYFHIATASWLVQVASCDDVTEFKPVALPLDIEVPSSLAYIPQFIITNLTQFLVPMKIYKGQDLLTNNLEVLEHFLTLILVFMGRPDRLVNVNVRAQLADALETILPEMEEDGTWTTSKSGNTEKVLNEHPLVEYLAGTILAAFVSTETTGRSVEDESKYNYRRSMHKVIQYIWQIPRHINAFKQLSKDAVDNISSTEPPLFLRFINLLINDAIFLLDEALDYMKQIHVLESERDSGRWFDLSAEDFQDKESVLQGLALVAYNRNTMANYTIYTLELMSKDIKQVFCHHVMVDRIAGMLNYFLEHLVGKKQCYYVVRDRAKYVFKPEQIVSDIAHIYVNLGGDERFCKAVICESRSFSESLFPQAMGVLEKKGASQEFVDKFSRLSEKIQTMEVAHKHEEEVLADAPEEFLDPIMGTLMVDPVKLPTSNTSIDRSVIARHLLSDQRDPFTNLPLTMEMVAANTELQNKIATWKKNNIERSEIT